MRRFVALLLLLVVCPLLLFAQAAQPLVPVDPGVAPVEAGPQAALRKLTRAERKLCREVTDDAAKAAGMRRLEFMRAVDRGDQYCRDELRMSLAANDAAREIDIERLQEIFAIILDWIRQLLAIWGMFGDASGNVDLYLCSLEAWPAAGPCDGGVCSAPLRAAAKAVSSVAAAARGGDCRAKPARRIAGKAASGPFRAVRAVRCRRAA